MAKVSSKARTRAAGPIVAREAAEVLRAGGLVIVPTDTVYGIAVDPANPVAVQRLYHAKGRDEAKPLQLLLADASWIGCVAVNLSPLAHRIAQAFLPGGITVVLEKAAGVPSTVVGGGGTVGVRVPAHPLCREVIRAFGAPLAATSGNRSGAPSPTTAQQAASQLGEVVDLIVDGGPCPLGKESTVLDLAGPRPRLLREGAISRQEIEAVLGCSLH